MENLKSYQSAYASLTAEITANLSRIGQNLKLDALPEDSIGNNPEFQKKKIQFNLESFSKKK